MATADADWLTLDRTPFDEVSFSRVWLLALATYGVGDIVTTIALVYFSPLTTEANPVIRQAIMAFGGGGFLALKLLVIYACIGISLWAGVGDDDRLMFYAPPLLLTAVGTYTTVHNLGILFH
ncbi:hypothetical protein ACFQMA_22360 [Halosimplex aquaticum]|uniref:DUF5658 domain-containing protein n=1 Tax=Halosimplex aquaticum TaxID=3026162 RepID=A0ABD5Y8B1_9EURY|nr:hypothetical protein [Halosimplex aquaticum]